MRGSALLLLCFLASGCLLANGEHSLDISLEKTQEGETNVCFTFSKCDSSESCPEPTTKCVKLDGDFFKNQLGKILRTIGSRPDLIALLINRLPYDVGMYDPPDSSDSFEYFSNVDPGSNAMMKMAKMAEEFVEGVSTMNDESLQGSTELPSTTGSYRTTTPNFKNYWKFYTSTRRNPYYRYYSPSVTYTSTYRTPYSRPYSRYWYTTPSPNVKDVYACGDETNCETFTGDEQFTTTPYPIDGWKKRNKRKMGRKGGRWNSSPGPYYAPKDWGTERPEEAYPSTAGVYDYGKKGPWKSGMPGSNVNPGMGGNVVPWKTFRPPPIVDEDMDWSDGKYKPWMMNKPSTGGPPMGGMDESEVGGPWMMDGMDGKWMGPNGAPWMMKSPGKYGPPMGGFGKEGPPMMGGMYGFGSEKPPMMGGFDGFGNWKPPMMGGMDGFGNGKPPMMGGMDGFGKGRPPMMGGMDGFGNRRPPSQDEGPPMMSSSMAPTLSTVTDDNLVTEEGITEI